MIPSKARSRYLAQVSVWCYWDGGAFTERCTVQNQATGHTTTSISLSPCHSQQVSIESHREGTNRVFPNQIINTNNNSVAACLNQCAKFGYPAAGLEYGAECCAYEWFKVSALASPDFFATQGAEMSAMRRRAREPLRTRTVPWLVQATPRTRAELATDCR